MDSKQKKQEHLPIIDGQCYVNLTAPISGEVLQADGNSRLDSEHGSNKRVKRCKFPHLKELLFAILIICFAVFMGYLTVTSGYFFRIQQIQMESTNDQYEPREEFVLNKSIPEEQTTKSDNQDLQEYFYSQQIPDMTPELRAILLQIDQSRLKRNTNTSPCNQNMKHCKTIMNSMLSIVSIVNISLPHLHVLLGNSSLETNGTKSKFVELVKCLQCKNDSTLFNNETAKENDNQTMKEHFDQAQIKKNVDVVNNLLDNDLSSNSMTSTEPEVQHSTVSIFYEPSKEHKSTSPEKEPINATTSASVTSKTEEATALTNQIDDTEQTTITMNVTIELDRDNATEIANNTVHPSMHPSDQGRGDWNASERDGENAPKSSRKSNYLNIKERIIFSDQLQNKGTMDSGPGMIPTAETMKSTQQLQLTPTMSWMPYQVCFYGPPANGPVKQSAPGQTMYPASSPGAPYPIPMSQQRPNVQNPMNQAPNYFQVQAQNVQVLPVPSFPGNFGTPGGQRIGPTGPGPQSYPIFPGHQSPSGGANPKPPYYCTYIPAPTFQFPAIPGVSEYQRSSISSEKEDDGKEGTDGQESSLSGYSKPCPFNMIRCGDGQKCIPRSQWCDGQVDCMDSSDEITCSCRDRISQERLCDGYFDCPHGEDELGCLGCPKTSFSCNDWYKRYTADNCVPLSQRCDGIKQCANGKDEEDCNILTPSYIEGKNVFTIGYTEGYLHKNYKGQWYPVCTAIDSWAKDACVSEIGPSLKEMPTVKIHSVPDNAYQGSYLAEFEGETKLIPSCMNTAVYVQCPRFLCGTTMLSQDPLPSSTPKNDDQNIDLQTNEIGRNVSKEDDLVGSQLRVVGGRASEPKAWPFLVAIYKDGNFHCGGIILNELWILTAAHCVDGYMNHYYEIQAGMLRRFSFSPMSQYRKARYAIEYPRYNSKDMTNDIGMIMLDDPLRFNRWVRPVCLPEEDILGPMWRRQPEPYTSCLAIGWGATSEHGPDPDHLREVEVPILKECKYETDQTEAVVCAGYPQGGRDACQGDSGGPLMCRNPYSESQWYVAGIVSHGEGCGRPAEPGAYTKVSYFLSWIQEISNGRGIPPLKRTPLAKCPGFSCNGGLGKCLPIKARCNRIIDCLDGEDELNCNVYWNHPLYRKFDDPDSDFETILPLENNIDNSASQQILKNDTEEVDTTDRTLTTVTENNEVEFDNVDELTTHSSNDAETSSVEIDTTTEAPITFTCERLLQSIFINKRCNREVDCEDSTDEMNCTCKDYLRNFQPNAICDGYLDCEDKTDEQDCEICSADQFFCKKSGICISMSQKCDTQFDCKYKEDELDCFTLTDGKHVYLDADERPFLNIKGTLTRNIDGKWRPTCHRPRMHRNQSTAILIGQNMCEYFGFAGLKFSHSITVKNSELETIRWKEENETQQNIPSTVSVNEQNETCPGLYIRCTPVLSGSISTYLTIDTSTGNHIHLWPWLAAIFVDGDYRCPALLLDHSWLLSASKCLENIKLDQNYVTAVFGYGPLFRHVDGPHQQVSIIDELQPVNNSQSILLHLKRRVNVSRHVQPLFLDKTIYLPGMNDTCVAVGTNEKYETQSIFLKTVLRNCKSCHRCFINNKISECSEDQTSDWSGVVFCQGRKGWYPAATFQDHKGPCSFRDPQTLTAIDHINPYLVEAMDGKRQSIEATCDGFRCSIGECIPKDRICDGVLDCRDHSDENPKYCEEFRKNCENTVEGCNCLKSELRCRNGACVDKSAFCDGIPDCTDASDEPMICTCAEYLKLTNPGRLCDGVRHCYDKTDESPELCPCRDDSLKCRTSTGNDTCIPQEFICDGDRDCIEGEDEATCRMLKRFSNDSDGSGEIISRSYGVWHTECFPNPISSQEEATNLCKTMGYTSGDVNNDTVITEEPMLPRRNEFYLVRLNNWLWMTLKDDKSMITLVESNDTCHRAFVDCV
nr:serine protease nudel [Osmia lignaria]